MKKIIVLTLLIMLITSPVFAADWSKYVSGRNNIRLDGYQGQPGYIEFQDGSGTIVGYLWMGYSSDIPVLRYCSRDAIDLTTTKLSDAVGAIVGSWIAY